MLSLQVAYKLHNLYVKLHELGHAKYIKEGELGPPLYCSISPGDAEGKVKEAEQVLASWKDEIKKFHQKFHWLLFFRVPKLLRVYHMLYEEEEATHDHIRRIVHEISFLCENDVETRSRMYGVVEVSLHES